MITKRFTTGSYKPSLKTLPAVGDKLKFSGEGSPLGTIKAVNEDTGTVVFKMAGYNEWSGRGLPRTYIATETMVLKHIENGNYELLLTY